MKATFRERIGPVLAMLSRDLRQIRRHGLPVLTLLTVLLLFFGLFLFTNAASEFRKIGTPTWTGGVLGSGPGPLRVGAEADLYAGPAPLSVNLSANITGGSPPYSFAWSLGEGNQSSARDVQHTYLDPGAYDVLLAVNDVRGDEPTRSHVRIIATGPGVVPLQVGIRANRTAGAGPLTIAFDATVVGGEPPYTYLWAFGAGETSAEAAPTHAFSDPSIEYRVNLTVRDQGGNRSVSNELYPAVEGRGESIPYVLLDLVYGYMVVVTMILLPVAFSSNFNSEMRKGTVRVLTLYPVGVLEATCAKLLYGGLAGLLFSLPVAVLPALLIGKPAGDVLAIFFVAYLLSLATVAVAAFTANAITFATKRMYLKPTLLPYLFILYSFVFTSRVFSLVASLAFGQGAPGAVQGAGALIALSPYHQGGLILSSAFGGPGTPDLVVFLVPAALLLLGVRLSKRLWPDIYEKE